MGKNTQSWKASKKQLDLRVKAIREFCADCVETPLDITFCTGTTCPLWEFRMGMDNWGTDEHRRKIESAFKNFPNEAAELKSLGIDLAFFISMSKEERLAVFEKALDPPTDEKSEGGQESSPVNLEEVGLEQANATEVI